MHLVKPIDPGQLLRLLGELLALPAQLAASQDL
jgi:hypothetical protein